MAVLAKAVVLRSGELQELAVNFRAMLCMEFV